MWSSVIDGETLLDKITKDIADKENKDIDFGIDYNIPLDVDYLLNIKKSTNL